MTPCAQGTSRHAPCCPNWSADMRGNIAWTNFGNNGAVGVTAGTLRVTRGSPTTAGTVWKRMRRRIVAHLTYALQKPPLRPNVVRCQTGGGELLVRAMNHETCQNRSRRLDSRRLDHLTSDGLKERGTHPTHETSKAFLRSRPKKNVAFLLRGCRPQASAASSLVFIVLGRIHVLRWRRKAPHTCSCR